MKIKVSHESPLALLDQSLVYNSFDYALVHLFDKYPQYYKFFERSIKYGREVLLDNSIFELGTAFDSEEFAKWIEKLTPTYYIIPDVLDDAYLTIDSFDKFINAFDVPGIKIGVIQGTTYSTVVDCYKYMSEKADYIALSFNMKYLDYIGVGKNTLERQKSGRINLVRQLIADGIWNWDKPHHLLGCSLPTEFKWYVNNNIYNIRSLDTSNPIMAGIKGIRYSGDLGLNHKPQGLLADHLDITVNNDMLEDIHYNIQKFREIIS